MRILIYGAGVIGSIFAGKLALAGNDITVLARNQRFNEISKNGIILRHPKGKEIERVPVRVISSLSPDDKYDYVLVVMQNKQVDDVLPVLRQNCSPNIVFVVNTASGYEKWESAIGGGRLMLGFPAAGGERKNGEVFYFVSSGIERLFQTTTFGEYDGRKSERVKKIIRLFNTAHIPSVFCHDMDAWQKTHVALITNIANALYGFDCDNRALGRSYRAVRDMVLGIKEGRRVLRVCGIAPTPRKLWWFALPTPLLSHCFALFMRTQLAETTMAKHCAVAKEEMIALQGEFDRLIRQSRLTTPIIDKLRGNLYFGKNPSDN